MQQFELPSQKSFVGLPTEEGTSHKRRRKRFSNVHLSKETAPNSEKVMPDDTGPSGMIDGIDAALAALLIAVCAVLYWIAGDFPVPELFPGHNVLPEQFPRMPLVVIGLLALLLPSEHRLELDRWPLIRKSIIAPIGSNTFFTTGFLLVLVGLGDWQGTILMIFIAATRLPILWGERRWLLDFAPHLNQAAYNGAGNLCRARCVLHALEGMTG